MKMHRKLTVATARRVVRHALQHQAAYGVDLSTPPLTRRYEWLRDTFVPALRVLSGQAASVPHSLLANGYFLLGDILSIQLGASRAAMGAYRASARWRPRDAGTWREIAFESEALGRIDAAARAYGKAVRFASTDDEKAGFRQEVTRLRGQADGRGSQRGRESDDAPCDAAWECIADFTPRRALELLRRPHTVEASMSRAAAYSALGDVENCLREWDRVASASEMVPFGMFDFYLISARLDRSARFWQTMCTIATRASGPALSGFCRAVPKPAGVSQMTHEEAHRARFALLCEYRYALRARDVAIMKDLKRRYPKWKQLRKY